MTKEITLQHYKIINDTNIKDENIGGSIKKTLENKSTFSDRLRIPNEEESDEKEGVSKYKIDKNAHIFALFVMLVKGAAKDIDKSLLDQRQVEYDDLYHSQRETESMREFTYVYVYNNDVILWSKKGIAKHIDLYFKWLLDSKNYYLQEQTQDIIKTSKGKSIVVVPTKKVNIKHVIGNTMKEVFNIEEKALRVVLEEAGVPKNKQKQILQERQLKATLTIEATKGYHINDVFGDTLVNVLKDNVQIETKDGMFTVNDYKQKKKIKVQLSSTGNIDELDMETKMSECLQEFL